MAGSMESSFGPSSVPPLLIVSAQVPRVVTNALPYSSCRIRSATTTTSLPLCEAEAE